VLLAWLSALPVVLWAVSRRRALRRGLRVARAEADHMRAWHGAIASAPLLRALGLGEMAVSRDRVAHGAVADARMRAADRSAGPVVMGAVGTAQVVVALLAVWLAAVDACSVAAAIAAIIATTTAAARSELVLQAASGMAGWRQALRRLPAADPSVLGVQACTGGCLAIAGVAGVMLRPGVPVALLGSADRLAALAGILRGGGTGAALGLPGGPVLASAAAASWGRAVAVVAPGDPLFAGPLRANLDPSGVHSDAEVAEALVRVGIGSGRPGVGFVLGPGGAGLSGGEAQRVTVARALLARPAVLVLVDPCRHLDAESAGAMHSLLRQPQADLVIVVLGADPATAEACAEVVVLADGGAVRGPAATMLENPAVRRLLHGRAA
jgi:hypothetical protein